MSLLTWRSSTRADKADLQAFECTDPEKRRPNSVRKYHAAPWEFSAQKAIHRETGKCGPARNIYVGYDGDRLGAVSVVAQDGDSGSAVLELIAVARRLREERSSRECADEAVEIALLWAVARAEQHSDKLLVATGMVHPKNISCQKLLTRHGFAQYQAGPLDTWRTSIPI